MDQLGHLPPQIGIECHSNINLCPIFYLKAYLCCTEPIRKKSDAHHVYSFCLGNNRQYTPICAKLISFWVRKVLDAAKAHMSPSTILGAAVYM